MKRKLLLLTTLLVGSAVFSQDGGVSIGIPLPNQAAQLHVSSDSKGVLLPKVSLKGEFDSTTISGGIIPESLLVYNTNATDGMSEGFYFWQVDEEEGLEKGSWKRLITSSDKHDLIGNQKTAQLVVDVNDENENTGVYIFSPDKDQPDENTTEINLPDAVKEFETITSLMTEVKTFVRYADDVDNPVILDSEDDLDPDRHYIEMYKVAYLSYKDEKNTLHSIPAIELLGGKETRPITNLEYDSSSGELLYTNEKGSLDSRIDVRTMVFNHETLTSLFFDGRSSLRFKDENGQINGVDLKSLVKTPWLSEGSALNSPMQATYEDEHVYTNAKWVGIGENVTRASKTNRGERLFVDGAISMTTSYYADYVFENYFEGESILKEDYEFMNLDFVADFIARNRHLPGVTAIGDLDKTSEGYRVNLSDLSIQLLEKTEELYLYTIEQQKEIELLKGELMRMKDLDSKIERLEQVIDNIK